MNVHLVASRVLPFAPEVVWSKIRDFNGLPDWHQMIASSSIETGKSGDQVGAVRNFFTHDGGNIREQLLALDDHRFVIAYNILQSDMGVSNYIAEVSLQRVTSDNSTFAVWTAKFDCASEKEQELKQFIGDAVFQGGLANLHDVLCKGNELLARTVNGGELGTSVAE